MIKIQKRENISFNLDKEICMKEAHYGCDDKNPCCDGLSCKIVPAIVPGTSHYQQVPRCTKDDYGNKHKSLIEISKC